MLIVEWCGKLVWIINCIKEMLDIFFKFVDKVVDLKLEKE